MIFCWHLKRCFHCHYSPCHVFCATNHGQDYYYSSTRFYYIGKDAFGLFAQAIRDVRVYKCCYMKTCTKAAGFNTLGQNIIFCILFNWPGNPFFVKCIYNFINQPSPFSLHGYIYTGKGS